MDRNGKSKWILVACIAAAVAAVTTIVVLVLRAKAKKKAWYEQASFDYDIDDCECFDDLDDMASEFEAEIEE
ncbi:MAG: hypothetical protein IIW40_01770 [Clostridia bacterium]|nr:hypothetical protein [Clostridia bacterium]